MDELTNKEIQKICRGLSTEEGFKREYEKLKRRRYVHTDEGMRVYDFTEEELEKARREKALRDYVEMEQKKARERALRPGIILTLGMLAFEFFMVKELAFTPPYEIWKIALGIFILAFCGLFHWDAYRG